MKFLKGFFAGVLILCIVAVIVAIIAYSIFANPIPLIIFMLLLFCVIMGIENQED